VPKKIRHACRFLAGNEQIAAYLGLIERNAELLRDVQRVLPKPLDEHCLHAALDAGALTLTTDSPVWSSRLRFFAPELARSLAPCHGRIDSCRVRIRPRAVVAPPPGTAAKYKLSEKTTRHLLEAAAGIGDADIAAALRRLAKSGSEQA
jgi:hypothetical protein